MEDLNTIITMIISLIFSVLVLIFAICAIVVFAIKLKEITKRDKDLSWKLIFIGLGITLIILVAAFINDRVSMSLEYYKTLIGDSDISFDIPYPLWIIFFIMITLFSAAFSSVFLYMYCASGLYLSRKANLPTFPMLLKENDTSTLSNKFDCWAILEIVVAIAFMFGFTLLLFRLTGTTLATNVQNVSDKMLQKGYIIGKVDFYIYMFLIAAAFKEELVFRLFIQRFLSSLIKVDFWGPAFGIFLTSVVWAIGHVGVLHPCWVKIV